MRPEDAPPLFETLEVLGKEKTLRRLPSPEKTSLKRQEQYRRHPAGCRGRLAPAPWPAPLLCSGHSLQPSPSQLDLLQNSTHHANIHFLSSIPKKYEDSPMKAVQVSKPGGSFAAVDRSNRASERTGSHQRPSLRRVPQRCARERRPLARPAISASSRARNRRTRRQDWPRRHAMEDGTARRRWLAWRALFRVRTLPLVISSTASFKRSPAFTTMEATRNT